MIKNIAVLLAILLVASASACPADGPNPPQVVRFTTVYSDNTTVANESIVISTVDPHYRWNGLFEPFWVLSDFPILNETTVTTYGNGTAITTLETGKEYKISSQNWSFYLYQYYNNDYKLFIPR